MIADDPTIPRPQTPRESWGARPARISPTRIVLELPSWIFWIAMHWNGGLDTTQIGPSPGTFDTPLIVGRVVGSGFSWPSDVPGGFPPFFMCCGPKFAA